MPSFSRAGTDQAGPVVRGCEQVVKAPGLQMSPLGHEPSPWAELGIARSVRVQHATVSHQHPVVFIPIRTACICPICAPAYPHKASSNRNRPGCPQSVQGSGLILSRPTRPAARLRPSTSRTLPRLPLLFIAPQSAQPRPLTWSIWFSPSSCSSGHVCLACAGCPPAAPTSISQFPNHRSPCLFTRPSHRQALMTLWPPLPPLSRPRSCVRTLRVKALR